MNSQKGSVTVALLVVLVVVLAVVLIYFAFLKKPGEVAVSPTPTLTAKVVKTATPIPTADRKIYANSQYGFEFQYPYKNISLKNCNTLLTTYLKYNGLVDIECMYAIPPSYFAPDYDAYIGVFNLPLIQALQSIGYGKDALSTTTTVSYNGINWTILPTENGPSHYFTERNDKTYWINHATTIKTSYFETILNTFKFTK